MPCAPQWRLLLRTTDESSANAVLKQKCHFHQWHRRRRQVPGDPNASGMRLVEDARGGRHAAVYAPLLLQRGPSSLMAAQCPGVR